MSAYVPKYTYGAIAGAYGWEMGLCPWPKHMTPKRKKRRRADGSDIALTKKGESYVAAALAEANGVFFLTVDGKDRASISTSIEKLINMLDDMEPDPDLEPNLAGWDGAMDEREANSSEDEPSLGWTENGQGMAFTEDLELDDADLERTLGWEKGSLPYDQSQIAMYGIDEVEDEDEREEENEHGGDINDEPHDELDSGDAEPFLGWSEEQSQRGCIASGDEFARQGNGPAHFEGDGYVAGTKVLRNLRRKRPDVPQERIPVACAIGDASALQVEGLTIRGKRAAHLPPVANVEDLPPSVLSAKDFWRLPWA